MNTTHIANGHDTETPFDWLSALEAVIADSKHRDKPRHPEMYTAALEAAYELLIDQVRQQQPVVDAAREWKRTHKGAITPFDDNHWRLYRAVDSYEEMQS